MRQRFIIVRTRIAVTLFLTVFAVVAFAQNAKPQWTTVLDATPAKMTTQLVSSSEESIKVRLQVPGFYTSTVTTPQGEAKVITVPSAVSTAHAGEPDVPMIGIPAAIGNQARMDIRVTEAKYMDFENIVVAPSKGDFPRTIDPATVPYTYGDCYNKDAFFPSITAELYEPYILRDFRGQNMAIHPFVYNPVTKTLRVYYDMTIEMYKVDDNGKNTLEPRRSNVMKVDPDFKSVYGRHFINYEAAQSKYNPLDEEGDLLIICYDQFINSMTDFVNWKRTRGVNTTIVGTSTAGTSYNAIKNYIQSQYNANNNLTHVLLVGDVAQIPGYSYSGGGSSYSGLGDNAYGQIVGNDIYNDVFIGRFSAGSVSQVATQVNRVITYERDLTPSATWLEKAEGISRKENGSGHNSEDDYQHMDNIRTDLLNYGYNPVYQRYANLNGYDGSSSTISSDINQGVGIINYANHGQETGWGANSSGYIYYANSHVNALTNENKLPFIFSVACLVGKYDHSTDCFAETWMRATNNNNPTGAVGTLMSYISQPWIPPMWAQDECIDILVGSYSSNIKHTWGGTAINGLMGIFDHYSTSEQQAVGTYQAWILYGDPSMMLRTKTPQMMTVTHPGTINSSATSYTVHVSGGEGALATITDADHNILGKATVNNGTAEIGITGGLTANSELTLCVFGYNKVTRIESITVSVPEGPYISLDSYDPNTALVGEDTELSIVFKNTGIDATEGATTVTLTSEDPNVTVVADNSIATFDVLEANATVTLSGFKFRLNQGVTLGNPVILHYTAVNGEKTWEGDLSVTPNKIFKVTVAANNTGYGTVSGAGEYDYNATCTVTATPAEDYVFANWTVNGNVVSTHAEYTFTVTNDMDLVAHFGKMIGDGTATNNYLPSYSYYNYSLTEQIYTAEELGEAGTITSIAFYNAGAEKTRTFDLYLKATTKGSFTGNTDWITIEESDKVFSGEVTMVANAWTTISFDTPFVYDGTSNVVLVTDDNSGNYTNSPHMSCRVFTAESQALYAYNDNTNFDPLSPPTSSVKLSSVKNQLIFTKEPSDDYVPCSVPTDITVSDVTSISAVVSWEGEADNYELLYGYDGTRYSYDFEDGSQGWTILKGTEGDSPHNWMHCTDYDYTSNDYTSGSGHNASDGFMLSESYISGATSGTGTSVTPDNYLVSPQVLLGGSITFWATDGNDSYGEEHFAVAVSTNGNTAVNDFTQVQEWTLLRARRTNQTRTISNHTWYEYTADLSDFSGLGYVAIRHFDCYDQWLLCIDDIEIVGKKSWTTITNAVSPCTLSNLESGTSYVVKVKSVCGEHNESGWSQDVSFTTKDFVMGDVNGNGSVDIGDAVCIVNYLVNKQNVIFNTAAVDLNSNDDIDIGDAVMIVNILVGKDNDNNGDTEAPAMNMEATERDPE